MHRGSSENNKIENGKESVSAHLPSLSMGFTDLFMLHWSKINLNHPLKASAKRQQPEKSISTLHSPWGVCSQHCCWLHQAKQAPTSFQWQGWTPTIMSPGHLARAGVHPQHSQTTGGPDPQPRRTQELPGTTSTAGPRVQESWGSVENVSHSTSVLCPSLEHSSHRHLCIPHLVTLLLKVFSAADSKKNSDWTEKASFCFWGT